MEGDNKGDFLFGEETVHGEDAAQAALEEEVFGEVTDKVGAAPGTKKRKLGTKPDPIWKPLRPCTRDWMIYRKMPIWGLNRTELKW